MKEMKPVAPLLTWITFLYKEFYVLLLSAFIFFGIKYYFFPNNGLHLLEACKKGDLATVEKVMAKAKAPVTINVQQDSDDATPLIIACQHNHIPIVASLLRNPKLQLDLCDNQGRTALYMASMLGHLECMKLLVRRGATVGKTSYNGTTPLIIAAFEGQKEVVEFLIANTVNIMYHYTLHYTT